MISLLETIRLENGHFENLEYHRERMNRSRRELYKLDDEVEPEKILLEHMDNPECPVNGLFRCRIFYARTIERTEFLPYNLPAIHSLRVIHADDVDYRYKYADRRRLEDLFSQKKDCDDILIVRNGMVTDTSYANVAFLRDGNWYTPMKPLLKGTRRASLLDMGRLKEERIKVNDLTAFEKIRIFNAMIRFEDKMDLPVSNIRF